MRIKNIMLILGGLLFLIVGNLYAIQAFKPVPDKIVKCYDRNYNEILGLTCYDKGYNFDNLLMNPLIMFNIAMLAPIFLFISLEWDGSKK